MKLTALAGAGLFALTFLFRLPVFLNPDALDSDIAVVGLQARHLLRGDLDWLIWGTKYQGIVGPALAALFDVLLPVRPSLSLALSAVFGHALLVLCLFGVARRACGDVIGALIAGLLIVVPEPLNFLTYSGFRTWAFTLAFAALYFGERAVAARRHRSVGILTLAMGLCIGLGYYADLFLVQLLPGFAVYVLGLIIANGGWLRRGLTAVGAIAGYALGSLPRILAEMKGAELTEVARENLVKAWPLFFERCLPYALGLKLFPAIDGFSRPQLEPGVVMQGLGVVAMIIVVAVFLTGGVLAVWWRAPPGLPRRLAWCGLGWAATSITAFLLTPRGVDMMSARYLVPILLGLPLAAVAVFSLGGLRDLRFAAPSLGAVLLHFAVAGWLGYGAWVQRGVPVVTDYGAGRSEAKLEQELKRRAVQFALGDYWLSYRLTLLWEERLIVVPIYQDRFRPYRADLKKPGPAAYIFLDTLPRGRGDRTKFEQTLAARKTYAEKVVVGPYTAFVLR